MSRPLLEVADLIRSAGTAFIERNRNWIRWAHIKVLLAIARCRTAALGCRLCGFRRKRRIPSCRGTCLFTRQNLDCVSETNRQLTEEREDRPEPRTQDHKNQPRNDLQGKASATTAEGNNHLGHSIRGQPGKDWKRAFLST